MNNNNNNQTQKIEASANDIENELIKLTTKSNTSQTAGAENSSIHSSAAGKSVPHQTSIKSETGYGPLSTKSGELAG